MGNVYTITEMGTDGLFGGFGFTEPDQVVTHLSSAVENGAKVIVVVAPGLDLTFIDCPCGARALCFGPHRGT